MLDLPESLAVTRDEAAEAKLYETAKRWLERQERAEGIHASDILMPRKGYWRHFDPQPLSAREVGLFLVGKVLHSFVLHEGINQPDLSATDEGSRFESELGLFYSPDKLRLGIDGTRKVIEVKTSRAFYEPKHVDELDHYLQQVGIYLACEQVTEGEIWVLYVNLRDAARRTSPAFRVFQVAIGRDDLPRLRAQVKQAVQGLLLAIRTRSHGDLALCPEWACGADKCPWWGKCKPEGRWKEPE